MIARAFKDLIMRDLSLRQAKEGGLMSQGIVKEIFKTRINSIITDKVLTDSKDIETRNACLKELL